MHTSQTSPPPGLLTVGETMGRFSAGAIGTIDMAPSFTLSLAGAESNVAIAAARLGARAMWVGRVGTDSVGDLIQRRLRAEGIEATVIRDRAPTGLMVLTHRTGAISQVDYHRSASAGAQLQPGDVATDLLAQAAIVHLTGITPALSTSAQQATFAVAEAARSGGVLVSVDVNYRSKLWDAEHAAPVLRELVQVADIVFAGPEEARLVLGSTQEDPAALAEALHRSGPAEVIIKDGPRGCVALLTDDGGGGDHRVPAPRVSVVDPVGAGDAFVGGYLAERLQQAPGDQRLQTAVRTGAYAVTVPGDCEGLPTRADLARFTSAVDVAR